jgi:hypothetical protein
MKHNNLFFTCLILVGIYSSCTEITNRVSFTINPNDRKIELPVHLNDSITANMMFDSGAYESCFLLDSTFFAFHPSLSLNVLPEISRTGSAWGDNSVLNLVYKTSQTVKIGNADLVYNVVKIANWKAAIYNDYTEGVFNIPKNDTTHVWEWNFENNYLEIHPVESFKMPENCFIFQMGKSELPFNIQIPLQITCANGDTLTINRTFTIDTGMSKDVAIMYPAEELEFFNKRDDAVWNISKGGNILRYTTVRATLFDNFVMDSLRIYTFNNPPRSFRVHYLIGLHFLKRFNVFFDMKNQQLGLQPIKNFQRIVNPDYRRFHLSAPKNSEGKFIVTEVANYKANYYKTAGFQVGDEIIAVNGKLYKDITYEESSELYKQDTLVFDVHRDGNPLKIVVLIDKTEEQGD